MTTTLVKTRKWPIKDPEEKLTYGHTWREAFDDPITVSEWTVADGMTKHTESIASSDPIGSAGTVYPNSVTKVQLSGGVVGSTYEVKNKVTFTSGNILVRRVNLQVELR